MGNTATGTIVQVGFPPGGGAPTPPATLTTAGTQSANGFQGQVVQQVASGATIAFNALLGNTVVVTPLSINATLLSPTATSPGKTYTLSIFTDATARTLSFHSVYRNASGVSLTPVAIPANQHRVYVFIASTTTMTLASVLG